jgi:hypothetical protein
VVETSVYITALKENPGSAQSGSIKMGTEKQIFFLTALKASKVMYLPQ